jgi:hypothetical protein
MSSANGPSFFYLVESDRRSATIYFEQGKHRSRLFVPQALRFGLRNIDGLVEHEGVFHLKLAHARAGLSWINQQRSNELKALPCPARRDTIA